MILVKIFYKFSLCLSLFQANQLSVAILCKCKSSFGPTLITNEIRIVFEYDQEILQSQTADKLMAPQGRSTEQSRDTRKTNLAKQSALSFPTR